MTPDRQLKLLRAAAEELLEHDDEAVSAFAERFTVLDEHLADGGELPEDWADAEAPGEGGDEDDDEVDEPGSAA